MSLSLDGATGNITGLEVLRPQLPNGAIIQTVNANTSTLVSVTTRTFTDTTLSATITTTSANSRVLVLVDQQIQFYSAIGSHQGCGLKLLRGSTTIHDPLQDTNSSFEYWHDNTGSTGSNLYTRAQLAYIDTPGAAGTYSYKTQAIVYVIDTGTPANAIFRCQNSSSGNNGKSYITLLEIA